MTFGYIAARHAAGVAGAEDSAQADARPAPAERRAA